MSGGEVTVGMVDEMPEASELGPPPSAEDGGMTMNVAKVGPALPMGNVEQGQGVSGEHQNQQQQESSNLSSLNTANQKPNV